MLNALVKTESVVSTEKIIFWLLNMLLIIFVQLLYIQFRIHQESGFFFPTKYIYLTNIFPSVYLSNLIFGFWALAQSAEIIFIWIFRR